MTAKEKAKEIMDSYLSVKDSKSIQGTTFMFKSEAKECALICVDEIIKTIEPHLNTKWWQEVKEEINKL